jgi:serine/threonine-protein kinase
MHATGRVHGFLDLANIFVTAEDEVRITEGGMDLARNVSAGGISPDLGCAAPEQLAGGAIDRRTDVYSLGAAFYELLTLRRPGGLLDPPSSINRTVPQGFDVILLRLLKPAPEDRYGSADEVLADLEELRRSSRSAAAPALVAPAGARIPAPGVPRAAMVAAGAGLGAVGGVLAGWLLSFHYPLAIAVGAIVGGVIGVFSNSNS